MTTAIKLNDTQLTILCQAARRSSSRVLPLPMGMTIDDRLCARGLKSLLRRDLIAEKAAARRDEEWRRGDDDERLTLVITEAGLGVVGARGKGILAPKAIDENAAHRVGALVPAIRADNRPKPAGRGSSSPDRRQNGQSRNTELRRGTKGEAIKALLERENGATVAECVEASGWQAHSVRGFISGTLKKRLGLTVASEKIEGGERHYRAARL